jgi:DNA helicase II / ATP-dependent DNA helicase PcrA
MTPVPELGASDLLLLRGAFPTLQFDDEERKAVLLEAGTRDINAAPGSGKTTILAAKLYLLAQRWPHMRRGICVITHTNVAREEIQRRLASIPRASPLLAYPHFIGTIHSFINQYLAIPWLRSEGHSIDVIDNDEFAAQALRLARKDWTLKTWMENNKGAADIVCTLQYQGADLTLGAAKGKLPGIDSKSLPRLTSIKKELSKRGVFRFEDMFAFGHRLLRSAPQIRQRVSHRFPLLLIDEMQDTSWAQEDLLSQLFDASVVVQRYGDVNQQILSSSVGADKLTFPRPGFLNISTSKRFSTAIASAVSSVQLTGDPVIGASSHTSRPPTLLLYTTEAVAEVIPRFGQLVLDAFSDEQLCTRSIRALCSRRGGDAKQAQGRKLGDYWPPFSAAVSQNSAGQDNLWRVLAAGHTEPSPVNLKARATNLRRAILLVLRAAKSEHVVGVRNGDQLFRQLHRADVDITALRRLCRDLALADTSVADDGLRELVGDTLYAAARSLLPATMSHATFMEMPLLSKPEGVAAQILLEAHQCIVERDGRTARIELGTVASMKGETHLASLVLESHGGQSKHFDLQSALPMLSGARPIDKNTSALLKGQYRNLYVAMSRPSHFLCLAMNTARAAPEHVTALTAKGWVIETLS